MSQQAPPPGGPPPSATPTRYLNLDAKDSVFAQYAGKNKDTLPVAYAAGYVHGFHFVWDPGHENTQNPQKSVPARWCIVVEMQAPDPGWKDEDLTNRPIIPTVIEIGPTTGMVNLCEALIQITDSDDRFPFLGITPKALKDATVFETAMFIGNIEGRATWKHFSSPAADGKKSPERQGPIMERLCCHRLYSPPESDSKGRTIWPKGTGQAPATGGTTAPRPVTQTNPDRGTTQSGSNQTEPPAQNPSAFGFTAPRWPKEEHWGEEPTENQPKRYADFVSTHDLGCLAQEQIFTGVLKAYGAAIPTTLFSLATFAIVNDFLKDAGPVRVAKLKDLIATGSAAGTKNADYDEFADE